MHFLITGGNGFIGKWVVNQLKHDGHSVLVFDRRSALEKGFLGDIIDVVAVTEAMAHCDGWIHLAGVLGTSETVKNPIPAATTNIFGGLNILQAASQYRVPGVNIAVGNYFENNTYAITKNTIERFCYMYRKYNDTPVSVVRALNAYGPGQQPFYPYGTSRVRKIIPSFICRALLGEPVQVYSDPALGSSVMDMIFVSDVSRVLVRTLYKTVDERQGLDSVIEAGTGRRTTVLEIAEEVIKSTNSNSVIELLPMRVGETPGSVVVGDIETLIPLGPDYQASTFIPLEIGLQKTVNYYLEHWLQGYLDSK